MATSDSSLQGVLQLAHTDLTDSAKAAYAAFQAELQSGGTANFQQEYTKIAADAHPLPGFDLIDPNKPPTIDKPGDYHEELDVNGIRRSYTIHVPPQYHG